MAPFLTSALASVTGAIANAHPLYKFLEQLALSGDAAFAASFGTLIVDTTPGGFINVPAASNASMLITVGDPDVTVGLRLPQLDGRSWLIYNSGQDRDVPLGAGVVGGNDAFITYLPPGVARRVTVYNVGGSVGWITLAEDAGPLIVPYELNVANMAVGTTTRNILTLPSFWEVSRCYERVGVAAVGGPLQTSVGRPGAAASILAQAAPGAAGSVRGLQSGDFGSDMISTVYGNSARYLTGSTTIQLTTVVGSSAPLTAGLLNYMIELRPLR